MPVAKVFLEGALAGYGIAIPVGAVAILIVNTGIACGFPIGFLAGAGAASADLVYAAIASLAGAALAGFLQPFAPGLRLVSGLVLIGLALVGLAGLRRGAADAAQRKPGCSPWRTYLTFVGITLINPLTVVYFTAFILGRGTVAEPHLSAATLAFVAGAGLASLSWQTILAAVGGLAGRHLTARFRQAATGAGSLLVLAFGIQALAAAWG